MDPQISNTLDLEASQVFRYNIEVDMNSNSTHATAIRLVGNGKRVLELGCSSGHVSRVLRDRGCQVVGIEIDARTAECAREFCERVIVGDLDDMNFAEAVGSSRFDVIIATDILEHLKNPLGVLQTVKQFLEPEGTLIVSIPNVAHLSVRMALLSGHFPYGETGLLDRTHIRFFTRESLERLFDDAGFAIAHFQRIEYLPGDPPKFEVPYNPDAIPAPVFEALSRDPDARTYQFVVAGYPLPRSGMILVQDRIKNLAHEAERSRAEAADLRTQIEHLTNLKKANEQAAVANSGRLAEVQTTLEEQKNLSAALQARLEQAVADTCAQREDIARLLKESSEYAAREESLRSQISMLEEEIRCLTNLHEAAQNQSQALRERILEQDTRNAALHAQVETLHTREKDLRDMLLDAHDQLLRRDEEIAATLAASLPRVPVPDSAASPSFTQPVVGKYSAYQHMLQRVRSLVEGVIPAGAKVLVISKGDDDLLRLGCNRGLHFPQRDDGVYAGYYPATDSDAIVHLKDLRNRGAQFLLIPQTALWWLDHYPVLARYLNEHFLRVIDQSETCIVYDLERAPAGISKTAQQLHPLPLGDVTPISAPAPSRIVEPPSSKRELQACVAHPERPFGVNISGHFRSEKGVGEGVRSTVRSLRAAGIPLGLTDFTDATSLNIDAEFNAFSEERPYSVNLVHANADGLLDFVQSKTEKFFEGSYNIGFWAWEVSRFPAKWSGAFRLLNEVWVPSTFVLSSVSTLSPLPVVTIPHSLTRLALPRGVDRKFFGLPADHFVFLFMFDFMSVMERKNPLGLIHAFKKAFRPRDKATLVLKVSHAESRPAERKLLEDAARNANIKMIDGVLTRKEINGLLNTCDCYVSLHRSEGFGLSIAEAMSLGKPVIATGYSGNMDYMTPANSFPVNYREGILERDYPPYPKGATWALPDLEHASELMRLVYGKRKIAREIGRQAQKDVGEKLSSTAVGGLMRQRFAALAALGKVRLPEGFLDDPEPALRECREPDPDYRRLVGQVRKLVQSATPAGATVMVISRGDDELLKLENRHGWHFPRQDDGKYAGYHPTDSAAAIGHLEVFRAKGAEFLLIPRTSLWWLEHYADFRRHLESSYRKVRSDKSGVLYELKPVGSLSARVTAPPERLKRKVNGAAHAEQFPAAI